MSAPFNSTTPAGVVVPGVCAVRGCSKPREFFFGGWLPYCENGCDPGLEVDARRIASHCGTGPEGGVPYPSQCVDCRDTQDKLAELNESKLFLCDQEAENLLVVIGKVKENCRESGIVDCSDEEACFLGVICKAHKTAWARCKTGRPEVPSSTDNSMKRPCSVLSPSPNVSGDEDDDLDVWECEQVVITDRELEAYIRVVHVITNAALMGGDMSVLLTEARTAVASAARDR
jgi:hypothetical protein